MRLDGLFRSGQYKAARAKMDSGNLADYTTYVAVNMVKQQIEMFERAAHPRRPDQEEGRPHLSPRRS